MRGNTGIISQWHHETSTFNESERINNTVSLRSATLIWLRTIEDQSAVNLRVSQILWRFIPSLALTPVPVLALVLALLLKLLNVVAKGIAVVLGPVITPAGVFFEFITDILSDLVHLADVFVWVLTPVSVVTAGIDGRDSEKESLKKIHGE
jgi:hypothetical protein